jgi:hypothetical protein
MSERGKPSTAHQYDKPRGQCLFCHMYQVNVESLSHNCTPEREMAADRAAQVKTLEKEANDHGE